MTAPTETGVGSTERRLMDAAVRAFRHHGYSATGIREIAKDAGLTIGALYHYAEGKEALFVRIVTEGYGRSTADAKNAAAVSIDPVERLISLVTSHVRGEVAERDLWRMSRTELNALTPESQAVIIELRDRFEAVWGEVITDGCEKGAFWPRDATIARLSALRMCSSVGDWYDPKGRLSLDEVIDLICEQTLALLKPPKQIRVARTES